jgi:hypothetical protein
MRIHKLAASLLALIFFSAGEPVSRNASKTVSASLREGSGQSAGLGTGDGLGVCRRHHGQQRKQDESERFD